MNRGHHEHSPSPSPASFDAFTSEYSKVRDGLPEQVRKPLDVFREEVMEICRAHGVDHPSKLVTPEAHATTETLGRVQELLEQIHHIFECKEVSLGHKDWEVEIPEGQSVHQVAEKDGKAFFSTFDKAKSSYIFDSLGKQRGYFQKGRIPSPGGLAIVDQRVACIFQEPRTSFVFVDGERVGFSHGYRQVSHLLDMDGELVYVAECEPDRKEVIFVNEEVYGPPEGYYSVSHVLPVGDQLAFAAQKQQDGPFYVYIGDRLIGDQQGYKKINEMTVINGKLVFVANDSVGIFFLVEDGVTRVTTGVRIFNVQKIDGQLSWIEGSRSQEELFVGQESYGIFYAINRVLDTKGDPLLIVQEQEKSPWIMKQGDHVICQKEAEEVKSIKDAISVGDDIIFHRRDSFFDFSKPWVIESATGVRFCSYKAIHLLKAVDDKHFIVIAEEDGKVVQRTFDLDHPPYQGELAT